MLNLSQYDFLHLRQSTRSHSS